MRPSKFRIRQVLSSLSCRLSPCPVLNPEPRTLNPSRRPGFTLTELLVVMMILGIMTGLALSGLAGAIDLAREQRTRAIISKLDQLIMERYEDYRTRSVPAKTSSFDPRTSAQMRLYCLRELMRMELPDRVTDVTDPPVFISQLPSAWRAYQRMALRAGGPNWPTTWTSEFQGSECLYLIVSRIYDGDKCALDYFLPGEIGDTDGDGMKEILDGWGQPIEFLRWAPGYLREAPLGQNAINFNPALTDQTAIFTTDANSTNPRPNYNAPDPFDPAKADPRWRLPSTPAVPWGFALRPLIFSAGRDKKYDIATQLTGIGGTAFHYSAATLGAMALPNDPYYVPLNNQQQLGTQFDADVDNYLGFADNITNHYQATP